MDPPTTKKKLPPAIITLSETPVIDSAMAPFMAKKMTMAWAASTFDIRTVDQPYAVDATGGMAT